MKKTGRNPILSPWIAFQVLFVLAGCSWFDLIADYDPVTYANLVSLKSEIRLIYEDFGDAKLDELRIKGIKNEIDAIVSRECAKDNNKEMKNQVLLIKGMFKRHISERRKSGAWSETHLTNKKKNMEDLIDKALLTESRKQ